MMRVESAAAAIGPDRGSADGAPQPAASTEREPLQPRPDQFFGSWWAIAVGFSFVALTLALQIRSAPCPDFHAGTQFSGSNTRLGRMIGGCGTDLGRARLSLGADWLLIVSYVFLGANILRRWWPLYQAPRLKQLERFVIALPFVVGGFDTIGKIVTLAILRVRLFRFAYPESLVLPTVISTFAWLKMLAAGLGVICVVCACLLALARRKEPADMPEPRRDKPVLQERLKPPSGLGVCCSGGGIRAAAYAIGALDELEQRGVMMRARWLTAVSGGNYAATAWTLAKVADPSKPAAADVVEWLGGPIESPRKRQQRDGAPVKSARSPQHRFLLNGPGGIGRSAIAALLYVALNIAVLGALVAAISWPVGRLVGSVMVQPTWRFWHRLPPRLDVPAELWLPGVVLMACGAAFLLVSALPVWWTSVMWRFAAVLVAIGLALEMLTVGIPAAMVFAGNWMHGEGTGRPAIVGASAIVGAVSAVWRLARKPITERVRSALPKLGGVLLVIAALVWGGKVSTDAATDTGALGDFRMWLAITTAFVAVYLFAGITRPTIHHIYRKRLGRSFGVRRDESGRLYSPPLEQQITWTQLPNIRPELVVCCAQQRDGIAPGGLPADTFTISRRRVRIGDVSIPTHKYVKRLGGDLTGERTVASWMATSGAAFASAMGRMSQGSTNALMAALNIDLGIWVPNPRLATDANADFPNPRFGYLFKEILGWYDQTDRFVFVADGGHWDNLGLVELLRRRCETIVCIDASGDELGRFTTLRQAVELASLELPDIVESINVDGVNVLKGADGMLPASTVAELIVTYVPSASAAADGTAPPETGRILYAKSQLATDLDVRLRRFSKSDPKFPNYSTASLFLTQDQFGNLVELGRASGRRLAEMVATPPPPPTPRAEPVATEPASDAISAEGPLVIATTSHDALTEPPVEMLTD